MTMAMAAEIVSSCRIGISPAMKKNIAPAHRPGSSSEGLAVHLGSNVLLERRQGWLLLINTTSGFGISLVAQWLFLPAIGVAITFEQK